jgi:signal transduction histidine kinase/DNA-binding response OmpR family regulator
MKLKGHRCLAVVKIQFTIKILVLGIILLIPLNLLSQDSGFKYFKNYSYKEYDHQPQNWVTAQAKNSIIYVANQAGVLEFDGVSWRVIYEPDSIVRSLAIDEAGTVFIGGENEIWYLAPDSTGTLKYVSLLDQLEAKHKNFSKVWDTLATKECIFFRTSKLLFRWNYKEMKVWDTPHSFKAAFVYNGELIVQESEKGLLKVAKQSLLPKPGGEEFAGKKIYLLVPYGNGSNDRRMLIGTRSRGFFLYDGLAATHFPVETRVEEYLKKNKLKHGIRLSSGDFALATDKGLLIMNHQGGLKNIIDNTYGLLDDSVSNVFQDSRGNLWLCLEKGIAKIEYSSPIATYDNRSNLPGLAISTVRHHDKLYVGTTKGLYSSESLSRFIQIPGIPGYCWSLVSTGDSVLAATNRGVFQVENGNTHSVIKIPSFVLLTSKYYPDYIWCGTSEGLAALAYKDGQWRNKYHFNTTPYRIRSITEDNKKNLWLGTLAGHVFNIHFPDTISDPVIITYDSSHGLPDREIHVSHAAGHTIFATVKGLFRFDKKTNSFIPDATLGIEYTGGDKGTHIFRIVEDRNKNIWFHSKSRNYRAIPQPGNTFKIEHKTFLRIPTTAQVNTIYPDPDGKNIWFASIQGLIRYDASSKKIYSKDFQTLIRKIKVNDMLIFDGFPGQTVKMEKNAFPFFQHRERNFYFEFAAPFFKAEKKTRYRCFLEGYDVDWSAWNKDTKKYYTNLEPGLYTFRVKAKNVYDEEGKEGIFQFKILMPWYKTWWALLLYILVFILLMYLIVKWRRSIRLEKEKKHLEHIVTERTKEIQEQKQQLENQTIQLKEQSGKLKEMDKVKSRFFANISHEFRTPLTLIMGPLEQMLGDSNDTKQQERLDMMFRSSRRLLRLINQLLDLSRFDSGKMKLQVAPRDIVSFLEGIVGSFHSLAQQEKLELAFETEKKDITLYFDNDKMEEVFNNLLINAVKFTPPGGKITVIVKEIESLEEIDGAVQSGLLEISVRDTGIGISQEQLPHVFDRFFQAGGVKDSTHNGTGIGLALVKEVVLLHLGQVDVHSTEGKGTEFVIRLPLGYEHLKPNEIIDSLETVPKMPIAKEIAPPSVPSVPSVAKKSLMTSGKEAGEEEEEKNDKQEKPLILVVEDNVDVRKFIRGPLEQSYSVIEAGDGKEGIAKAKKTIPDLIVSDIMMPEVNGIELCKVLKKNIKTSHIPIILLTAKASEESEIKGLETGADDYVTKPFNTKILLTRIKNLIGLRQQLQQKIQNQMLLQPVEIEVSSMDREFIDELQETIEKNLSDPEFNVNLLSKKLYMDRTTIYRKIMALTGETPTQFIRSYRLKRAAQLLRDKFGNVSKVSLEVGILNLSYFSKCFKEKFHQLPSDYQESSG